MRSFRSLAPQQPHLHFDCGRFIPVSSLSMLSRFPPSLWDLQLIHLSHVRHLKIDKSTVAAASSSLSSSQLSTSYASPARTSPFRSSSPVRSSPFRSSSPLRSFFLSFPSRYRPHPHLPSTLASPRLSSSFSSPRPLSPSRAASSALAKETLDRIDKLRNFEKHVRELRDSKFREYFELSPITGDWAC